MNRSTTYAYGQAGELQSVTLPGEASATFAYDNVGRLSKVMGAASTLLVGYDFVDRLSFLQATETQAVIRFASPPN